MSLAYVPPERERQDNRSETQPGDNGKQRTKDFDGVEIDFVHALVSGGPQQVGCTKHMKEERCVVRRRFDVERIAPDKIAIPLAARYQLEFRAVCESWSQDGEKLHGSGQGVNRINIRVGKWADRKSVV